jgi:hypothetical protein
MISQELHNHFKFCQVNLFKAFIFIIILYTSFLSENLKALITTIIPCLIVQNVEVK